MARKAVWLDCDPGHDDAMAIILAAYSPALQLLGISTVASNQTVDKTTRNALDVLELIGLGGRIGVFKGQARPLLREAAMLCPEIHGETGLDGPHGGPVLPHCGREPAPGKAPVAMGEAILRHAAAHPGEAGRVQLVCTGALSNAALMLALYPEVAPLVDVTIMGGAIGVGNTGPVQEFNIQVDPEAARIVFEAGVPLTMVPLEVTHTALATPDVMERMFGAGGGTGAADAAAGAGGAPAADATGASAATPSSRPGGAGSSGAAPISPFKGLVQLLLTFFAATYSDVFGFKDGAPLHDPCAVAAVIAPELFQFEQMRVDVETLSPLSAGQTVCDIWHTSGRPKNCRVARSMDVERFWELMLAAVDAADAAAPMNAQRGAAPAAGAGAGTGQRPAAA